MSQLALRQISFHDPDGVVFTVENRVLRRASQRAGLRLRRFLETPLAAALVQDGVLPATRELSPEESADFRPKHCVDDNCIWFEHDSVPFVSYAHEWIPEMLLDAAQLTVSLAKRLQVVGWDIKDASTNNIVFRGTCPVFVDLCSIVERRLDQPYWWPKGQFERHFILPLMAYVFRGLSPDKIHLSHLDGLDPANLYSLLGIEKWTTALALKHCTLPALLATKRLIRQSSISAIIDPQACTMAQSWQLRSLENSMAAISGRLPQPVSNWHSYTAERCHYTQQALDCKRKIVGIWLREYSPTTVLDIGANTGEFSVLAAANGARVYALEKDIDSARIAYASAKSSGADCQILLQDIGSPSPAMGWRQAEKKSLGQRIEGNIDCILALALIHHWLISAAIPLDEIVAQLALWTRRYLIIEYVAPEDSMFQMLCRQRQVDYSWLNEAVFRERLQAAFSIIAEADLGTSTRTLFFCERHPWLTA